MQVIESSGSRIYIKTDLAFNLRKDFFHGDLEIISVVVLFITSHKAMSNLYYSL